MHARWRGGWPRPAEHLIGQSRCGAVIWQSSTHDHTPVSPQALRSEPQLASFVVCFLRDQGSLAAVESNGWARQPPHKQVAGHRQVPAAWRRRRQHTCSCLPACCRSPPPASPHPLAPAPRCSGIGNRDSQHVPAAALHAAGVGEQDRRGALVLLRVLLLLFFVLASALLTWDCSLRACSILLNHIHCRCRGSGTAWRCCPRPSTPGTCRACRQAASCTSSETI